MKKAIMIVTMLALLVAAMVPAMAAEQLNLAGVKNKIAQAQASAQFNNIKAGKDAIDNEQANEVAQEQAAEQETAIAQKNAAKGDAKQANAAGVENEIEQLQLNAQANNIEAGGNAEGNAQENAAEQSQDASQATEVEQENEAG